MEKRRPHYQLTVVRSLIAEGHVKTTQSARHGAVALGFGYAEMIEVIVSLKGTDFYKSMTSHLNHTIWQDVYRPVTPAGDVYLKLTVMDDVLIVSFKER
jgi:motility quorum-sensing regulator/GCU-specific mRNA interferase toxin